MWEQEEGSQLPTVEDLEYLIHRPIFSPQWAWLSSATTVAVSSPDQLPLSPLWNFSDGLDGGLRESHMDRFIDLKSGLIHRVLFELQGMMKTLQRGAGSRKPFDVFLSFGREDGRKNFVDHLYIALAQAGFNAFKGDEHMEIGENIQSQLQKAILGSRSSVIIFSKNYASSRWRLDELVMILEHRRTSEHAILPVFYGIDPSHVRTQTGAVAEAFACHKERFKAEPQSMDKMKRWRSALTEVALLGGMVIRNQDDGDLLARTTAFSQEEEIFVETVELSMNEKHDSGLQCVQMPQPPRSPTIADLLPKSGEIMQLVLLEQQPMAGFDATNHGGNSGLQCVQVPQPSRSPTVPDPLPKGGEIMQLDLLEQQPVAEFDATTQGGNLGLQCVQVPQPPQSPTMPDPLPNGEIMHLFEHQSLVEFDAKSHGGNIDTASQSLTTIALSENTRKKIPQRECRTGKSLISFDNLRQHFDMKRADAAESLGVSIAKLKRDCRRHGITRWPYHKKNYEKSPFELKLETAFAEQGAISPTFLATSPLPGAVQCNHHNSPCSKPPKHLGEKNIQPRCMTPSSHGLGEIGDHMLRGSVSSHKELHVQPDFSKGSKRFKTGSGTGKEIPGTPTSHGSCQGSPANTPYPHPPDLASRQAVATLPDHSMPQGTSVQDMGIMTVKAEYGEDIIKFKLSGTSGVAELREEVAKRLTLEVGTFNIKYKDDDGEWILMTCNANLQECFDLSRLLGNNTLRLLVNCQFRRLP